MKAIFSVGVALLLAVGLWFFYKNPSGEALSGSGLPPRNETNPSSLSSAMAPAASGGSRSTVVKALAEVRTQPMPYREQIANHMREIVKNANPPLNLTDGEFTAFTAVVLDMLRVNGLLKAQSSKIAKSTDGKIEITVPARPEIAIEMQKTMKDQLAARLGEVRANEIDEALRKQITTYFWAYGYADERFELIPRDGASGTYDYDFSAIMIPNSANPEMERILKYWGGGSESGTNTKLADLIANPQYSFLADIIRQ